MTQCGCLAKYSSMCNKGNAASIQLVKYALSINLDVDWGVLTSPVAVTACTEGIEHLLYILILFGFGTEICEPLAKKINVDGIPKELLALEIIATILLFHTLLKHLKL